MFDIRVTRLPYGSTNNRETSIFSDMPFNARVPKAHEYQTDFDTYASAEWVNTGAGTAALTAGDGGLLLITSAVSALQSLQKTPYNFVIAKNARTWGRVTATLDSLVGTVAIGLLNVTTTPFTGASQTDGIYFLSTVTTGALSFNIAVGGTITSVSTTASLVAGSPFTLSFYYDGALYTEGQPNGRVVWEISGAGVSAALRGEIDVAAASTFPGTTGVTPTLAVNATTAVARTLTVDNVWFAKDRGNINSTPTF